MSTREPSPPSVQPRIPLEGKETPPAEAPTLSLDAVLRSEEAVRARVFHRVILALVVMVAAFLPFLPGAAWLRVIAGISCGFEAALCAFVLYELRDEFRYTPHLATCSGIASAVNGVIIIYYIGLFSAAAMVLNLGIYFYGLSQSRFAARGTFAVVASLYLVASSVVAAALLPDESLFSVANVAPFTRWFQVLMSQVVFGVTFFLASSSRRAAVSAMDRVHHANLELGQRDALLAEARGELARALRAGEGRYSGETLGDYRLGDVIGRGGMGEVYGGVHVPTDKPVAVKLLHPNLLDDPEHVKRFLREAEATCAVRSPHVTEVFDVGKTPAGAPFLVMELLVGHDLGWHLRNVYRLPLGSVVDLVMQTARALAAVRDAGIVHRDIKPGNLFLTDAIPPMWKVLDFGLSKVLTSGSAVTKDLAVGTPSYMAPEQVRGDEIDHLADQYALAALAYRAITGNPPFSGDDVANVLFKVMYTQPPSPAELVKLPVDVELVLAIGMAKAKTDRFAFVEEFADALELAESGDLDDETRRRGWGLLKAYPWGATRAPKDRARRAA